MEEKKKAIAASSKVISTIMNIGYVITIVVMCICVTGLIILAATGGQTSFITSGGIKIIAIDAPLTSPAGVAALCVSAIVASGFLCAIFRITYGMFKEINTTRTPFNPKYVRTIKVIGILVAVMTVICGGVDSLGSQIAGVETFGICTDATGIIFGAIIFCLAYVFDYGCTLQQQSDETL